MTASQIIGKSTAKWFVTHDLLNDSSQFFSCEISLLTYIKSRYLERYQAKMTAHEKTELIDSDIEGVAEIVARRLLRGKN